MGGISCQQYSEARFFHWFACVFILLVKCRLEILKVIHVDAQKPFVTKTQYYFCNSFSYTSIPRANAAMGEKVHGDMAEKDAAVPAAWYLAPVSHRRDPSQCIHVSIRLWIVLTHHHSSLSWKLPKLPALHYGRYMWDASGSLLMFLWPPEEDFRCSTHKPCQNNQRQGNTICEARDHWFLMNEKWWFEFGDFFGGWDWKVMCSCLLNTACASSYYLEQLIIINSFSDLNVKRLLVTK